MEDPMKRTTPIDIERERDIDIDDIIDGSSPAGSLPEGVVACLERLRAESNADRIKSADPPPVKKIEVRRMFDRIVNDEGCAVDSFEAWLIMLGVRVE